MQLEKTEELLRKLEHLLLLGNPIHLLRSAFEKLFGFSSIK